MYFKSNMNVLTNLIYGSDEKKEDDKEEKEKIEGKICFCVGLIQSVEEWEHFYIKINDLIFILKRDNTNFDNLIQLVKVNETRNINYIKDKSDRIITNINKNFYGFNTIISNFKTNSSGNTYVTLTGTIKIEDSENVIIVLKRNHYNYCKLYNKLNDNQAVKLTTTSLHNNQLQIIDIKEPTGINKETIVIGCINIGKEINEFSEFVEIIYKNHEKGIRFLIPKSLNNLKDQGCYKISYLQYSKNFYNILSYEEILK